MFAIWVNFILLATLPNLLCAPHFYHIIKCTWLTGKKKKLFPKYAYFMYMEYSIYIHTHTPPIQILVLIAQLSLWLQQKREREGERESEPAPAGNQYLCVPNSSNKIVQLNQSCTQKNRTTGSSSLSRLYRYVYVS